VRRLTGGAALATSPIERSLFFGLLLTGREQFKGEGDTPMPVLRKLLGPVALTFLMVLSGQAAWGEVHVPELKLKPLRVRISSSAPSGNDPCAEQLPNRWFPSLALDAAIADLKFELIAAEKSGKIHEQISVEKVKRLFGAKLPESCMGKDAATMWKSAGPVFGNFIEARKSIEIMDLSLERKANVVKGLSQMEKKLIQDEPNFEVYAEPAELPSLSKLCMKDATDQFARLAVEVTAEDRLQNVDFEARDWYGEFYSGMEHSKLKVKSFRKALDAVQDAGAFVSRAEEKFPFTCSKEVRAKMLGELAPSTVVTALKKGIARRQFDRGEPYLPNQLAPLLKEWVEADNFTYPLAKVFKKNEEQVVKAPTHKVPAISLAPPPLPGQ